VIITHEALPAGSFTLRGFEIGKRVSGSDIDLVATLKNMGGGVCELSAAKGKLDAATNILIGVKAMELGFTTLLFNALSGSKVTRWAKYLRSDEAFDYYEVDLIEANRQVSEGMNNA
jgi:hypothetical protein